MPKSETATKSNGRIDQRVDEFIQVRDEIERIEKEVIGPLKALKERLAGTMLEFLDRTGQKSAKTAKGTVSVIVKHTSPLTDPDAFMEFVRKNDAYELMDRRANSTACREYAEQHGKLPPGVKINATRTAGVTRA